MSTPILEMMADKAKVDSKMLLALLLLSEKEGPMQRRRVNKALGITTLDRAKLMKSQVTI